MEFAGKNVLITGATSGIGRATATAFVRAGARVGVNHLQDSAGYQLLRKELGTLASQLVELPADVSQAEAVAGMIEQFSQPSGTLDVLVNNAGISQVKPFLQTTEFDWDQIINTDLKSVFLCCRYGIPAMRQPGGAIINLASELAYTGRAGFAPYTAAKGGVISLTRSLAREFAPGIRVNAVAPGPTQTPFLAKEMATPGHEEKLGDIPLGRFAQPAEIADSILFLASDRASYYCGDTISPSGGCLMR